MTFSAPIARYFPAEPVLTTLDMRTSEMPVAGLLQEVTHLEPQQVSEWVEAMVATAGHVLGDAGPNSLLLAASHSIVNSPIGERCGRVAAR